MGNPPRYIPPSSLVEVTTRTVHGRFLLRPSRELNEVVYGLLARAAARYDVDIVDFAVLSNHAHLLVIPPDAEHLALFMGYFNGNLAKEAGRLHEWREKFWARRYRAIIVSDEPEAQISRLEYLLAQGCKEGLVRNRKQWPGASGSEALLTGSAIRGWWFDRSAEFEARRRGQRFGKYTFAEEHELVLARLPCWQELTAAEYKKRVAALAADIESETRDRLEREGRSPMGRKRIMNQHPHEAPANPSRSPAPRFHAATADMRKALEIQFHEFRRWYRQAAAELLEGRLDVEFPPGCFPPRLPFRARGDPPLTRAAL